MANGTCSENAGAGSHVAPKLPADSGFSGGLGVNLVTRNLMSSMLRGQGDIEERESGGMQSEPQNSAIMAD